MLETVHSGLAQVRCGATGGMNSSAWLHGPMRAFPALLLGLVVAVAGCSSPEQGPDPDDLAPLTTTTYLVQASIPTLVQSGEDFSINVTVTGPSDRSSDHIGAHFGANRTSAPSTMVYNMTCTHQTAALPGTFQSRCSAPADPGVYYLRGHVRIIESNVTHQWWGEELAFTVA